VCVCDRTGDRPSCSSKFHQITHGILSKLCRQVFVISVSSGVCSKLSFSSCSNYAGLWGTFDSSSGPFALPWYSVWKLLVETVSISGSSLL